MTETPNVWTMGIPGGVINKSRAEQIFEKTNADIFPRKKEKTRNFLKSRGGEEKPHMKTYSSEIQDHQMQKEYSRSFHK